MLKYLLLGLVVVALIGWARLGKSWRQKPPAPQPAKRPPPTGAAPSPLSHEDMPACAHCGMHLPRSEALPGRGGVFCSAAHRAAHEAAETGP